MFSPTTKGLAVLLVIFSGFLKLKHFHLLLWRSMFFCQKSCVLCLAQKAMIEYGGLLFFGALGQVFGVAEAVAQVSSLGNQGTPFPEGFLLVFQGFLLVFRNPHPPKKNMVEWKRTEVPNGRLFPTHGFHQEQIIYNLKTQAR